ncbi:MAG: hypothetical protein VKJ04_11625 [Vampirovibrionales bacterium]|nr:hypothetical protein [Vampirovibrionales bacterium]
MKQLFGFPTDNSSSAERPPTVRPAALADTASLQTHIKCQQYDLQQHQEEFLAWLESTEINGKNANPYKKIR